MDRSQVRPIFFPRHEESQPLAGCVAMREFIVPILVTASSGPARRRESLRLRLAGERLLSDLYDEFSRVGFAAVAGLVAASWTCCCQGKESRLAVVLFGGCPGSTGSTVRLEP
jgi:hypothetical protein